jgi:hypothetical protein
MLTLDRLREVLDYNPTSGVFTWKRRQQAAPGWNTRYAGKRAGSPTSNGYRTISIDYEVYLEHRLAWFFVTGSWPSDEIDHRNCIRNDNRFGNLRPATHFQNGKNQGMRANNRSGFKGVSWCRATEQWRATIRINGKVTNLGRYRNLDDAIVAYRSAAANYHGEFANSAVPTTLEATGLAG